MRDKFLIEKYLLLKIIHRYENCTRYKLMLYMNKYGYGLSITAFYSLFRSLNDNELVKSIHQTTSLGKNKLQKKSDLIVITNKGVKSLTELEFKIRSVLFLKV